MYIRNDNSTYKTQDIALGAFLLMHKPIESIETGNDNRSEFVFLHDKTLDELIEGYWRETIPVLPRRYFESLRSIKARLYS